MLETGQIYPQRPLDKRDAPIEKPVGRAGALGRQQRVAADQKQEQPLEPPSRTEYFAHADATGEQYQRLKCQESRYDKPPNWTCLRKRGDDKGDSSHRQQVQYLQRGDLCPAAVVMCFSHVDLLWRSLAVRPEG